MPLSTLLNSTLGLAGPFPPFLNLFLSLTLSAALYTAHAQGYLHIPYLLPRKTTTPNRIPIPRSVHYHFTRTCTRTCHVCLHHFHAPAPTGSNTNTHIEPLEHHQSALRLLAEAGMRNITFAGGEPLLQTALLRQMIAFCKRDLGVESVTVVATHARLVSEGFLREQGRRPGGLDVLAVGFDGGGDAHGQGRGRGWNRGAGHGRERMLALERVAGWCRIYGVRLRVDMVVDGRWVGGDMNGWVERVRPWRWVCFQFLEVREGGDYESEHGQGDGAGKGDKKEKSGFEPVSDEQFTEFCERHKRQTCLVAKAGHSTGDGRLVVDEYLRFLDPTGKKASKSILEVGVERALGSLCWEGVSWDVEEEEG